MINRLKLWWSRVFPRAKTQREIDAEYLADSSNLADLERRLKEIEKRVPSYMYRG
jgi:hypothetical protein